MGVWLAWEAHPDRSRSISCVIRVSITFLALIRVISQDENKAELAQASLGSGAPGKRGAAVRTRAGLGGRGRAVVVRGAQLAGLVVQGGLEGAGGAGNAVPCVV